MRIIAICYLASVIVISAWLIWEWRADVRHRKYWREHGTRRDDRLPPMN